jgi:hypothetical protein
MLPRAHARTATSPARPQARPVAALASNLLASKALAPRTTPVTLAAAPPMPASYVPGVPCQSSGEFSPLIQEFLDDCDYAK